MEQERNRRAPPTFNPEDLLFLNLKKKNSLALFLNSSPEQTALCWPLISHTENNFEEEDHDQNTMALIQ